MNIGWRLVRCVVGVGGSALLPRLRGVGRPGGHDRHRRCLIFVVEGPLCSKGWYQRSLSQSSESSQLERRRCSRRRPGKRSTSRKPFPRVAADQDALKAHKLPLSVNLSPKVLVQEIWRRPFSHCARLWYDAGRSGYK